jgi:hypothetical protein
LPSSRYWDVDAPAGGKQFSWTTVRRREWQSPRWEPRGLGHAVINGLLFAALNVGRAMFVDRPCRGTAGAPYVDHQHQVERDRSSPAMSSSKAVRKLTDLLSRAVHASGPWCRFSTRTAVVPGGC